MTANGSDETFNEGVRAGCIGNTFDFVDIQNAKVSCPLIIGEQRIMARAEVLWDTHSRNSAIEHSTQGKTVHITRMHAEANDAPRELIHDHEHPVCLEQDRLTSKQIYTPKTIFHMADKSQP